MRTALLVLFLLFVTPVQAAQSIHVLVALCDNANQGIVPVPKAIGNGQDPSKNLYWGARYGVKHFMLQQPEWKRLLVLANPAPHILERIVFKHAKKDVYLVADAYDGARIKECTLDFLHYTAGQSPVQIQAADTVIKAGADAAFTVYIGHNGLMDFSLPDIPEGTEDKKRAFAVFACKSKAYFAPHLAKAKADPVVWTTNFMAPEAYVLHATVSAWLEQAKPDAVREKVAAAYNKYQKCGIKGARRLFTTGW